MDSRPSDLGMSPGRVHSSVFIGAQVYKYVEVNLALQWTSIYLRRRGNKNTVVTLYLTLEMNAGQRGNTNLCLNAAQSETPFRPLSIFCLQQ